MKKLFLLSMIALFVFTGSQAQYYLKRWPTVGKDSVSNTTQKYATWPAITVNGVTDVRVTFDNGTGTSAGYALLQVRSDTTNGANEWIRYPGSDTAFILDNTTHIWNLTNAGLGQIGNGFRIDFRPSGTHKTYFWASFGRR